MQKYPYFIYPAVKALRKGVADQEESIRLRRLVAANVGDIPALRIMLGLDPEEFARFYPDMLPPSLTTADTIDSFLSRFGNPEAPTPSAVARIPIEPAIDIYTPEAGNDDTPAVETSDDPTASAIDAFLATVPAPHPIQRNIPSRPGDDNDKIATQNSQGTAGATTISESAARDFIKNHNYQSALEIIQRLILINPEKSIYFADQIRFLRKLIVNEAKKQHETPSKRSPASTNNNIKCISF